MNSVYARNSIFEIDFTFVFFNEYEMYSKFIQECINGNVSEFPSDKYNLSEGLRMASGHGHFELVQDLHRRGADLTINNNDPICWASAQGYIEIVKYLVENRVSPTVRENYPLRIAIFNGLPRKKQLNQPYPKLETWPITDTSFGARSARLALYLLDLIRPDLSSFILDCIQHGEVEVIQYLYTHINPGPVSQGDSLFLRFASRYGDRMVQFLFRHDFFMRSKAETAQRKDPTVVVAEKLNVQALDNEALMNACESGHTETVDLLLRKGADPTARNYKAFQLVSQTGNIPLLKILVDALFGQIKRTLRPFPEEKKDDVVVRQKSELRSRVKKLLLKEHREKFENILFEL